MPPTSKAKTAAPDDGVPADSIPYPGLAGTEFDPTPEETPDQARIRELEAQLRRAQEEAQPAPAVMAKEIKATGTYKPPPDKSTELAALRARILELESNGEPVPEPTPYTIVLADGSTVEVPNLWQTHHYVEGKGTLQVVSSYLTPDDAE